MPAPLDPHKRAAIADAIREGGHRNAIAREHGVSPSTVTSIAKAEGLDGAFDRSSTKRATEARNADVASGRAELKHLLLEDALKLRRRLWQPYIVHAFAGSEGTYREHELDEPPAAEKRNLMTSLGIAVDKIVALERLDQGGGLEEAQGLIRDLVAGIREGVTGG